RAQDGAGDAERSQPALVAGLGAIRRGFGLAEEQAVHVSDVDAGCAYGEDADVGGVQVAVAAEAPEDDLVGTLDIAVEQDAVIAPRLPPPELRFAAVRRPAQGADDSREDLAHVPACVNRKASARCVVDDPDLRVHQVPPSLTPWPTTTTPSTP